MTTHPVYYGDKRPDSKDVLWIRPVSGNAVEVLIYRMNGWQVIDFDVTANSRVDGVAKTLMGAIAALTEDHSGRMAKMEDRIRFLEKKVAKLEAAALRSSAGQET